jgi:hypothetical protein
VTLRQAQGKLHEADSSTTVGQIKILPALISMMINKKIVPAY